MHIAVQFWEKCCCWESSKKSCEVLNNSWLTRAIPRFLSSILTEIVIFLCQWHTLRSVNLIAPPSRILQQRRSSLILQIKDGAEGLHACRLLFSVGGPMNFCGCGRNEMSCTSLASFAVGRVTGEREMPKWRILVASCTWVLLTNIHAYVLWDLGVCLREEKTLKGYLRVP